MNDTIKDLLLSENKDDNKLGMILLYQKYKHPQKVMDRLFIENREELLQYYIVKFEKDKYGQHIQSTTSGNGTQSYTGKLVFILKTPEEM